MTAYTGQTSSDLPCHLCGYDLRAHPRDGQCPECGAPVAESLREAAIPRRPAWRDSDPRWRRRMLAGAWVLVLLPLMDALKALDWASGVPVPAVLEHGGTVRALDDTLLCQQFVYQPLAFCVGVVLLFSKERGRRRGRLDWTRRWGVLCCYVVLFLCATGVLFLAALVSVGIAAIFQSLPLENQPTMTQALVKWTWAYFRYGPQPTNAANVVLVAFSSIAILLACIPLFDALRSSGPRRLAAVLLAPLALFSLMHLAKVGRCCLDYLDYSNARFADLSYYEVYFRPAALVTPIAVPRPFTMLQGPSSVAVIAETVKWCTVLAIAVWMSMAQLAAWRQRKKTTAG